MLCDDQPAAAAAATDTRHILKWLSLRLSVWCIETTVVVRPDMDEWSALEDNQIVVQQLDLSGMRVISHVLSQSVALDYFNW